jgi:nicotinamide riboside kinase
VADPARDLPHAREEVHAALRRALVEMGAAVVDVRGVWPERRAIAAGAVAALLGR